MRQTTTLILNPSQRAGLTMSGIKSLATGLTAVEPGSAPGREKMEPLSWKLEKPRSLPRREYGPQEGGRPREMALERVSHPKATRRVSLASKS